MDKSFILIVAGIVGSLVGSFLNVCIFRLPRECMSIVKPVMSRCPVCLKDIKWFDNIPILSFIILGGKCRFCKTRISMRYPFVELLTVVLFCYLAYVNLYLPDSKSSGNLATSIMQIYLSSAMIVVTFIDAEFRIIPNEITLPGIILSLLFGVAFPQLHYKLLFTQLPHRLAGLITSAIGVIVGGGLIFLIGVIGKLSFKKEAMGLGDVKYMAMLGGFFGWQSIVIILVMASFLGSIFGIIYYLFTKNRYIPFGPFISLAAFVMLLFESNIYKFILAHFYLT